MAEKTMQELLRDREAEYLKAQETMTNEEFGELVKKLRQDGLADGDLGYLHNVRLIDKLTAARRK